MNTGSAQRTTLNRLLRVALWNLNLVIRGKGGSALEPFSFTSGVAMSKTYAEKLKDPRWQQKRLRILERDEWACLACNAANQTLHVHHKAYEGEPWDVADEFLETLCEECHANRRGMDKFFCQLVKTFPTRGMNELASLFAEIQDLLYADLDNETRSTISAIEAPLHFGRAWFQGLKSTLSELRPCAVDHQTHKGDITNGINECGSECPPLSIQQSDSVRVADVACL
jgi:hypothetical protein